MFSVGWTLVSQEDPEAAFALLKDLCPGIDLTDKVLTELKNAASETRAFLPDGWIELNLSTQQKVVGAKTTARPIEAMDAMLPMLLQKEVLDATGNSPDKQTAKSKDLGETFAENPVSEIIEASEDVMGKEESALPGV